MYDTIDNTLFLFDFTIISKSISIISMIHLFYFDSPGPEETPRGNILQQVNITY